MTFDDLWEVPLYYLTRSNLGESPRPSRGLTCFLVKNSPLKAPNTSSPRSTLQSFLESMNLAYKKLRTGEPLDRVAIPYYRAKSFVNLSEVPSLPVKAVSGETAIKL